MPGLRFFQSAKPILPRRSFRTAPALPEFVSECGDIPLGGLVSDRAAGVFAPGHPMRFLCVQVSLVRVLKILFGGFVPAQVIFFSMLLGAGAMGVRGKIMMFSGYLL